MKQYKKHTTVLSARHPKLKKIIELVGPMQRQVPAWDSLNEAVVRAIVSQMLSSQAARSIITKLLERFGTADRVIAWAMKQPPGPAMGLSRNKVRALAEWGKFIAKNKNISAHWQSLSFEEYKKDVTKIWGLGSWTADMIAIFHFGRMDVWPQQDAGVVKAARLVFGTAEYAKISKYIAGSETVTCLYFWEMLNKKIEI